MLRIHPSISDWISIVFLSLFVGLGAGCNSPQVRPRADQGVDKDGQSYYTKVLYYPFEEVWRATQLSVKYPIALNNMDTGNLETEWIKASDGFISPLATETPTAGYRYKLSVNMVKGRVDNRASVRVTIRKKIEKQTDFFSDVENVESDGMEEKIIIYRIEREILIDEAIKKTARAQGA